MTEVTSIHAPKIMKRFMNAEALRYLFIGVCTTLVNLIVFTVLCKLVHMDVNLANFISIVTAILFAYVTNKLYVFRSHCASVGGLASECVKFCGANAGRLYFIIFGAWILVTSVMRGNAPYPPFFSERTFAFPPLLCYNYLKELDC